MSSKLKSDKQILVVSVLPRPNKNREKLKGGGGGGTLISNFSHWEGGGGRNLMAFESREAACCINPFTLRGIPGKRNIFKKQVAFPACYLREPFHPVEGYYMLNLNLGIHRIQHRNRNASVFVFICSVLLASKCRRSSSVL